MALRHAIAIDMGRHRLRAILASRRGDGLAVRRTIEADLPAAIDRTDPEAVGRWIGKRLREGGFPVGRVTVAVGRKLVGLKRMHLPSADLDELPEMTRLAMRRELPFDPDGAVIDFVPEASAGSGTTVLAVAIPAAVLDALQRMMAAAGCTVDRIGLRAMGAAALLRADADADADDAIIVDLTGEDAEFCVVAGGAVRFARAAEIPGEDGPAGRAAYVVTETRRTWLSYRIVDESSDVHRALLLGERAVTERATGPIGEMLHVPATALADHARITGGDDGAMERLWPLAGLLLEPILGVRSIDLAAPRRAPDRGAHRRRRAIVAAGLAVLALLGAWTVANLHLGRMQAELAGLRAAAARLEPEYVRHARDGYRLVHLQRWEGAGVSWLAHADHLATLSPPPRGVVLDSFTGSLRFDGVDYDRSERRWSAPAGITIVLDGEARDRRTADRFRAALVDTDLYTTSSSGADAGGGRRLPVGFTYRLRTDAAAPPDAGPEPAP